MQILDALRQVILAIVEWADENKVQKIDGKGLSTNDYTTEDKTKVAGMANNLVVRENKLYLAQDETPLENTEVTLPASGGAIVDNTLSVPDVAADAKVTGDKINELSSKIDDLLYKPIDITSFKHNSKTQEIGSKIESITLSWKINRTPTSLDLSPQPDEAPSITDDGSAVFSDISSTTKWTLTVTGEKGEKDTADAAVSFYNGVYYGAAAEPAKYDSDFIRSLTRDLRSNKLSSINVTAGDGQYIYYCLPTRYGKCTFTLGGLAGGFELVDTIDFTNASGYDKDKYYIYKSSYAKLGNPTITIA